MRTARAIAIGCLVLLPVCVISEVHASTALPTCAQLAGLIVDHQKVLSATSAITPVKGTTPAYCLVNLLQTPTINIAVGLPLSAADGGTGGVQGAWMGKVQNLGGGGFGGSVGSVAGPIATGYVGSSTDTGHSNAWCNAINPVTGQPNSQLNCGASGGGFILDPQNNLLTWQVKTYMKDSIVAQTLWALQLTKMYYGEDARWNYWTGCSGGGRQGFELAEDIPELFDGFLNGAPAIEFDRFIMGQAWVPTVAVSALGSAGLSLAKADAAAAAALAACDADDGVVDGLVNEPRRCKFDANALRCTGSPTDAATCLTQQEAEVINSIWAGPFNEKGQRLWGALPKGTPFDTLLTNGNAAPAIVATWVQNWLHQDPNYNMALLAPSNYTQQYLDSFFKYEKNAPSDQFVVSASTDSINLEGVRKRGGKIIHYHGKSDPLTLTYGSYTYVTRLFDHYGVAGTQKFMRTFYYPGNFHCGGGSGPQIDANALFQTLQNWVEKGQAPDHIVASGTCGADPNHLTGCTRPICKYPDEAVYNGSGSTNDAASFHCVVHDKEPSDLREYDHTAVDHLIHDFRHDDGGGGDD